MLPPMCPSQLGAVCSSGGLVSSHSPLPGPSQPPLPHTQNPLQASLFLLGPRQPPVCPGVWNKAGWVSYAEPEQRALSPGVCSVHLSPRTHQPAGPAEPPAGSGFTWTGNSLFPSVPSCPLPPAPFCLCTLLES